MQAIKVFLITVPVQRISMKDLYSVIKKNHLHVDLSVRCLYCYCIRVGFCQTSWRSKKWSATLLYSEPSRRRPGPTDRFHCFARFNGRLHPGTLRTGALLNRSLVYWRACWHCQSTQTLLLDRQSLIMEQLKQSYCKILNNIQPFRASVWELWEWKLWGWLIVMGQACLIYSPPCTSRFHK